MACASPDSPTLKLQNGKMQPWASRVESYVNEGQVPELRGLDLCSRCWKRPHLPCISNRAVLHKHLSGSNRPPQTQITSFLAVFLSGGGLWVIQSNRDLALICLVAPVLIGVPVHILDKRSQCSEANCSTNFHFSDTFLTGLQVSGLSGWSSTKGNVFCLSNASLVSEMFWPPIENIIKSIFLWKSCFHINFLFASTWKSSPLKFIPLCIWVYEHSCMVVINGNHCGKRGRSLLIRGGCGWGGRVVVLQPEGRQFNPQSSQQICMPKCPWARCWTLNCAS